MIKEKYQKKQTKKIISLEPLATFHFAVLQITNRSLSRISNVSNLDFTQSCQISTIEIFATTVNVFLR